MKQIDILIPKEQFAQVNELLYKHKITGFLVFDVSARGGEKPDEVHEYVYVYTTGRKYVPEFVPRTKFEVLVADSMAKPVVDDLVRILSMGYDARGKILVKDVAETYDIALKAELRPNL